MWIALTEFLLPSSSSTLLAAAPGGEENNHRSEVTVSWSHDTVTGCVVSQVVFQRSLRNRI